jgi:prepilin-type processing-associated H-X9-DG protein
MRSNHRRSQLAFTLIEILVVIAIIMVLAGIIFTVGVGSRAKARGATCANQMRQIGMALGMAAERGVPRGWAHRIGRWNPHEPLLLCADGPQDGRTNYGVNKYLVERRVPVSDTGATVLLYESKRAGDSLQGDASDVDLRHLGGANFVFLDGHVKWSKEIPEFKPE